MLYIIKGDNIEKLTCINGKRKRFFEEYENKISKSQYIKLITSINEHFNRVIAWECSSTYLEKRKYDKFIQSISNRSSFNKRRWNIFFEIIQRKILIERESDCWSLIPLNNYFPEKKIEGEIYFRINKPDLY